MNVKPSELIISEKLRNLLTIATADKRFITGNKPERLNCLDYLLEKLMEKILSLSEKEKRKIENILSAEQKLDILEKLFLNYIYNKILTNDNIYDFFGPSEIEYALKMIKKFKTEDEVFISNLFNWLLNDSNPYFIGRAIYKALTRNYEYIPL